MSQIVVTVELSKADRDRLDAILHALTAHGRTDVLAPLSPLDPVSQPAPASENPAAPAPAPAVPLSELQQAVAKAAAKDKAKTRELVHAYAPSVSAVPEEKRQELLEKVRALLNGG